MPTKSSDLSKLYKELIKANPLENFEDSWHLGNYVLDHQSGKKSFEPMSIYVRLGMHFLYYGAGQEAMLQEERPGHAQVPERADGCCLRCAAEQGAY
jgi:phosphatidylserine decarboxylase